MKTITSKNKQSTREIILHAIKTSNQANIEKLAEVADISPVTVRHHINTLQAAGLIESESIRRKVGRPYYVYSLSEKGQELFPKRYISLTKRLLGELKARLPEEIVHDVFNSVVEGVLDDHKGEYEHLSFEDKLDYLVGLLGDEGFTSTWERSEIGYILKEHSCPYISIGQEHSEICTIDTKLIINVLQAPIKQHSCLLQGADCCEFVIDEEHSV